MSRKNRNLCIQDRIEGGAAWSFGQARALGEPQIYSYLI
jgi:hypothetical protein